MSKTVAIPAWLAFVVPSILVLAILAGGYYYWANRTTVKTVYTNTPIPFKYQDNYLSFLPAGSCSIVTSGKNGTKIDVYQVTYRGGKQVSKVLVDERTVQPVTEVKNRGGDITHPIPTTQTNGCGEQG